MQQRVQEGVVKYEIRFESGAPPPRDWLHELIAWRTVLRRLGLIGIDPARYGGVGYGNVSRRLPRAAGRGFIITGTQTAALEEIDGRHFAIVTGWDIERNALEARGGTSPSSESLTHAMLYDLDATIEYVFHVHATKIWRAAESLDLPVTARHADYGTPAMAREVIRLFREDRLHGHGVFVMGGHEDGVVSFGPDAEVTGSGLLLAFTRAVQLDTRARHE